MGPRSSTSEVNRLRLSLQAKSVPADTIPGPAARVFDQLVREVGTESNRKLSWELRILKDGPGNAFSLPNGAVYVDPEMVQTLAGVPGLWAAILSHEIVHITRQHAVKQAALEVAIQDARADWRFFAPEEGPLGAIFLGPSVREVQEEFVVSSQDLELDADEASLDLVAQAGFHPGFVIALYHLMQVEEGDSIAAKHFCTTHPGWDAREASLRRGVSAAVAEFKRRWPEAADSPGGNPPALAFVGRAKVTIAADHNNAEISLPLRCENSTGMVKIVVLLRHLQAPSLSPAERTGVMEQTIACMSDQTIAKFAVPAMGQGDQADAESYVMDDRGWVLARSQRFRVAY